MAKTPMLTARDETTSVYTPNQKVTRLSDKEAFSLALQSVGAGSQGYDPTLIALRREWFINVATYLGYSDPDYASKAPLAQFNNANYRMRVQPYSANHVGRICRGEIARLSGQKPGWDVIPNTADQADRYGAKVAQQHLDHYYEAWRMEDRRYELNEWRTICGTGFYMLDWDPSAGQKNKLYQDPFTQQILESNALSDNDRQVLDMLGSFEEQIEGDFMPDIGAPFQVRIPLGPRKWEDVEWITITHLRSLDWLWEHYPKVAEKTDEYENDWSLDGQWFRRLASLVQYSGRDVAFGGTNLAEGIEVHQHWRRPRGRFTKGLRVVFTNNHLCENGVHPFAAMGIDVPFPAFPVYWQRAPGRIWGHGLVNDLRGPQEDYNRGRRQLINQRDVLSKAQWLASRQSRLGSSENITGRVWEYDARGGPPPQLQSPPAISQAHVVTRDHTLYDMQTIAAQSEATQGINPAGVDSGIQLARLQEQDARTLGPAIQSDENGWVWFAETALKLTAAFVKTPRLVRVVGTSLQGDVMFFRGLDLNGNTSVVIRPGSMMPRSKAETQQTILRLLELGALIPGDPDVQRYILDAFSIGGLDSMFHELDLDRRRAHHEEQMFLYPASDPEFAFPDVEDHDDHQEHLRSHMRFMKTDDYELLPVTRKLAFRAHVEKHKLAIAQMIQAQQLLQGMSAMGAGGPGGGSPPRQPGEASQPRQRRETPGSTSGASAA